MRTISRTGTFKRDYRREIRGRYRQSLDQELVQVLLILVSDEPVPERYHDHPMRGFRGHVRNCHIRPDLVLLYRKPNDYDLELVRLGSHSELGI